VLTTTRPQLRNYRRSDRRLTEEGWVVDKGDVTDVIDAWDHRFLVEEGDPLVDAFEASGDGDALVVLDHPPTAEVMSVLLEQRMLDAFPRHCLERVGVGERNRRALCDVLMPVASDIEEPTTDADTGGGPPDQRGVLFAPRRGNACWRPLGVCADVWV